MTDYLPRDAKLSAATAGRYLNLLEASFLIRRLPPFLKNFVIEAGRQVVAVEAKAATRWEESDLAGLRAFAVRTPACLAAVLAYNGRAAVQLEDKLFAIPLGHLLG